MNLLPEYIILDNPLLETELKTKVKDGSSFYNKYKDLNEFNINNIS